MAGMGNTELRYLTKYNQKRIKKKHRGSDIKSLPFIIKKMLTL